MPRYKLIPRYIKIISQPEKRKHYQLPQDYDSINKKKNKKVIFSIIYNRVRFKFPILEINTNKSQWL